MSTREEELLAFRAEIDLVAFAMSEYGFEVERKRNSRATAALMHPTTGEKIRVSKRDGVFVYASVHNPDDQGTIIQFVQNRGAGNLGEVRKLLRPHIGQSALPRASLHSPASSSPPLEEVARDFMSVAAALEAMSPIAPGNYYLEAKRCIPAAVYLHPKFSGRICVDGRSNLVFPHWQSGGELTGYELKNAGFTGFAKGGSKRLWGSRIDPADTELVIAETAIDALSYAALFGVDGRRFVSTAGALNTHQPPLLQSAMQKLPEGGTVVLAVDADEGGDKLAERIRELYTALEGASLRLERRSPSAPGDDWNDVLRAQSSSPPPPEPR